MSKGCHAHQAKDREERYFPHIQRAEAEPNFTWCDREFQQSKFGKSLCRQLFECDWVHRVHFGLSDGMCMATA